MAVTFRDYIFNCYRSRFGAFENFRSRGWDSTDLAASAAFTRYIKVPLDRDVIEVPCIYKYLVMRALSDNVKEPDKASKDIYIPMICMYEDSAESRSSNPLVKKFLYESYGESNLCKKKGSGTVYLGGEGIILYEDFTPLVMLTLEITKDALGKKYIPTRQIVRINPVVYNNDDLLAKYIKTKFLTGIVNMKLNEESLNWLGWNARRCKLLNYYEMLTTDTVYYDFKVIIEDFSDFFFTPEAPDVTFDSEKVNQLLLEDSEFMDSI